MILVRTSNEFQGQMRLVLGILVLKIEFAIFLTSLTNLIYLKGKDVIKKMQSILDSAERNFFPLKLEKNVITSEQSDVIYQRGEEKRMRYEEHP